MNKEYTRNQKRMYRIHKQDEKIKDLELLIGTLQLENKELKEQLEGYKELEKRYNNLKEEYKDRTDTIHNLFERIDKAIEYIKNNSHKTQFGDLEQDNESIDINDDVTDTEFIENLLEILKGEG